ncbi:MAG: molybdopterin-guanine dinucleotide biosynthesis protein B [Candidatus Methanoperedens sp.]|nr:molybdopterin-guanine dinucleotide biosynthesis protein B [Candidatus Methanoperedens sp.]
MIPVICILGKSKSDKTRLMEDLIKELKNRSLRVGAIKYHKHGDFDMDIEGKDSWKYAKAGADTVAVSSSVKFALIKKVGKGMEIDEICEKYFMDIDIVLADGFTLSDKPRIIVAESDDEASIFKRDCPVIAVVGKSGLYDIESIVNKIIGFLDSSIG